MTAIKYEENILFKCTIPTRPPVKKNTQKVVRRYGQTRVVYSKQFRAWEDEAILFMKKAMFGSPVIDVPLEMKIKFYLKNASSLPDLSNLIEAPQDALKKAGVIKDDRLIQVIHAERFVGHEPRTEIELYALEQR